MIAEIANRTKSVQGAIELGKSETSHRCVCFLQRLRLSFHLWRPCPSSNDYPDTEHQAQQPDRIEWCVNKHRRQVAIPRWRSQLHLFISAAARDNQPLAVQQPPNRKLRRERENRYDAANCET